MRESRQIDLPGAAADPIRLNYLEVRGVDDGDASLTKALMDSRSISPTTDQSERRALPSASSVVGLALYASNSAAKSSDLAAPESHDGMANRKSVFITGQMLLSAAPGCLACDLGCYGS